MLGGSTFSAILYGRKLLTVIDTSELLSFFTYFCMKFLFNTPETNFLSTTGLFN